MVVLLNYLLFLLQRHSLSTYHPAPIVLLQHVLIIQMVWRHNDHNQHQFSGSNAINCIVYTFIYFFLILSLSIFKCFCFNQQQRVVVISQFVACNFLLLILKILRIDWDVSQKYKERFQLKN